MDMLEQDAPPRHVVMVAPQLPVRRTALAAAQPSRDELQGAEGKDGIAEMRWPQAMPEVAPENQIMRKPAIIASRRHTGR